MHKYVTSMLQYLHTNFLSCVTSTHLSSVFIHVSTNANAASLNRMLFFFLRPVRDFYCCFLNIFVVVTIFCVHIPICCMYQHFSGTNNIVIQQKEKIMITMI